MIKYFIQENNRVTEKDSMQKNCWINMINPTAADIETIAQNTSIEANILKAALDDEEMGRVEIDGNVAMIILDMPIANKDNSNNVVSYSTIPVSIILTEEYITTVCLIENSIFKDIADGFTKNINPAFKSRFVLQILFQISSRYMQYLRQIDKIFDYLEKRLYKSTKNRELIQLLDLQKSLVYINTSLKTTEMTLQKIERGRILKMYEEDKDLFEDVMIEFRQAKEMADIYNSILTGTMDAFASVISNNVNDIMKRLTYITILMAVPTLIASFYGMNVKNIPFANLEMGFWIPVGISAVIMSIIGGILFFTRRK